MSALLFLVFESLYILNFYYFKLFFILFKFFNVIFISFHL